MTNKIKKQIRQELAYILNPGYLKETVGTSVAKETGGNDEFLSEIYAYAEKQAEKMLGSAWTRASKLLS